MIFSTFGKSCITRFSRYGTLKTWANELGYHDAVKLLDATLKEEKTKSIDMRRRRKLRKGYPLQWKAGGGWLS